MPLQPTTPDAATWDAFVRRHPRGHLLQLSTWGTLKAGYGWQPWRMALADASGALVAGGQILLRRLPLRLGKLAYLPFGPLVDWTDESQVSATLAALRQAARQQGAAFLKLEPGFDVPAELLVRHGLHPSPQTIQPPSTLILDLDDEAAIQKRMNQMTRRNLRKSEKFEITVRQGSRADVDQFNTLLDETGDRKAFGVHVASYYATAYDLFVPPGDAALFIASYGALDLAGVFVFRLGQQAWYLYGASRGEERQRMAPFAAQWAGIRWALEHGCTTYDLYGIPDADEATLEAEFEQRHAGLWGVYRHKRGWGGRVARTVGAWDAVYNRPVYWLYHQALRWRGRATSE
ncbi:MAG: aminoacyltransferase [Anaerolineae bacterium]|nr:aminoacyltransferase [Anaerolineae bacterium]